jgi:alpha-mannosidase
VAESYAVNDLLIVWATGRNTRHASRITHRAPFVSVDCPNVVIETIKQAEDGQGLIVRLYESQRRRGEFTLTAAFPLAEAWRTNLLEENQERLEIEDHQLRFSIKPYQIVTLRLLPK